MINVKVYNRWAQFLTPYTRKVGMAVRYVLPQPVQANERQTQEKEKKIITLCNALHTNGRVVVVVANISQSYFLIICRK